MANLISYLQHDKLVITAKVIKVKKDNTIVRFNNIDVCAVNSANRILRQGDSVLLNKTNNVYYIVGQIEGQNTNKRIMEVFING